MAEPLDVEAMSCKARRQLRDDLEALFAQGQDLAKQINAILVKSRALHIQTRGGLEIAAFQQGLDGKPHFDFYDAIKSWDGAILYDKVMRHYKLEGANEKTEG